MESNQPNEAPRPSIGLYMIFDKLGEVTIGGIHPAKHDAPAVRYFDDVARMENSTVGRHAADFQLIRVGTMAEDGTILDATRRVVLEGSLWLAQVNAAQGRDS